LRKALFGGSSTETKMHNKYVLSLQGTEDGFHERVDISVLNEPTVCGRIPSIPYGPWFEELKQMGIRVSDIKSQSHAEIDILIESDYWGQLLTGRVV
jgi:hypothetical protein